MTTKKSTPSEARIEAAFDHLAQRLGDGSLSRRRALTLFGSGLVGGLIGPFAPREDVIAKKKKKKKKKGNGTQQPSVTPGSGILGPPFACPVNGADCGTGPQAGVCVCQFATENLSICQDVVTPPGGTWAACDATVDCPPGQVCAATGGVCRVACSTA